MTQNQTKKNKQRREIAERYLYYTRQEARTPEWAYDQVCQEFVTCKCSIWKYVKIFQSIILREKSHLKFLDI